jgi:hypothetical protein
MGNHCIDCDFCGKDQRVHGVHCCKENIAHQEAQVEASRAKQKADSEYLAQFGLKTGAMGSSSCLYASHVIEFLKKHEDKLKPPTSWERLVQDDDT